MKMGTNALLSSTLGVLLALTGAACASATKTETQTVTQTPAATEATTPAATADSPTPPPAAAGTIDNPIAYGASGTVGKWNLKVVGFLPNATSAVLHENQFNDKPKPGQQYVLVTLHAQFAGNGHSDPYYDLVWTFISRDGTSFEDPGEVYPHDMSNAGEIPAGVAAEGNVGFMVKSAAVAGGKLYVTPNSFGNAKGVFFALTK